MAEETEAVRVSDSRALLGAVRFNDGNEGIGDKRVIRHILGKETMTKRSSGLFVVFRRDGSECGW